MLLQAFVVGELGGPLRDGSSDAVASCRLGLVRGRNDVGVPFFDPSTGAGYDGLTPTGCNDNRGAESTLAALATLQCVRRAFAPVS